VSCRPPIIDQAPKNARKKTRLKPDGFFASWRTGLSGALDVGSLLALGALHDFEGDFFAFLQGLETIHVDRGEVREEIFAAIVRRNKAEAFGIIEPLDSTDCHVCNFLTKNIQIPGLPDTLFEFNDPVLATALMQFDSQTCRLFKPLELWRQAFSTAFSMPRRNKKFRQGTC
jgi:hypothetical protein